MTLIRVFRSIFLIFQDFLKSKVSALEIQKIITNLRLSCNSQFLIHINSHEFFAKVRIPRFVHQADSVGFDVQLFDWCSVHLNLEFVVQSVW